MTAIINLQKIQLILKDNKSISENKINLETLQKAKIINKKYKKLKLLGTGDIDKKFDIDVNFVSSSAKEKIEKLGGKVNLLK